MTGATSGTAYPSIAPEITPVFSGVRVTQSLVSNHVLPAGYTGKNITIHYVNVVGQGRYLYM
jgi:hypothetical protein